MKIASESEEKYKKVSDKIEEKTTNLRKREKVG